jgi:hypothetical protein
MLLLLLSSRLEFSLHSTSHFLKYHGPQWLVPGTLPVNHFILQVASSMPVP